MNQIHNTYRRFIKLLLLVSILLLTGITYAQETLNPATLPLLPEGQHVTIEYGEVDPTASGTLDDAFIEVLSGGVYSYTLTVYWLALQPTSDEITLAPLTDSLTILEAFDLFPYLSIPTIDTVNLVAPPEFMNPGNPAQLADGLHFNDPALIESFGALLDEVVPVLVDHGGFYLSVGNEVDGWLSANPNELAAYLEFVSAARERVHAIAPELAVGVTMTYSGAVQYPYMLEALKGVSDVVSFTYYPLNPDFTVRDPSVVADDMDTLVELAGDTPLILQEVGYPSGYLTESTNGSSGDLQARFVENIFTAIAAHPEIRFVSFLQLGDWSDATCDFYSGYYGVGLDTFREYLCTLGLRTYSGEAKPAYQVFLDRLESLNQN